MAKARKKTGDAAINWAPTFWDLDDVKPYPHNTRTHPPAQVDFLALLFLKFGPDQPIVVDEKGVILKGHGRRLGAYRAADPEFAAAHKMKPMAKTFPVVQRFGMTDDDKRAMRIADNQSALLSGWDNELMRFEIESLRRNDYDIGLLGFGEAQLVSFETTPGPPGSFPQFGEDIETEHECPKCHYKWSGKPTPDSDGDRPAPRREK